MNNRIPLRFDRDLKPEWIDFSLANYIKTPNEDTHRELLREYLVGQVVGTEARIKTVTQLQRTAGPRSSLSQEELEGFYKKMCVLSPEERTPHRLALLEQSIPFFADTLKALHRMKLLGTKTVSIQHLYEHMVPQYGDRKNLRRCLRYILQTLHHMQLVSPSKEGWVICDID
jgi:hypothetical protein